jgi:hypothetical protein
MLPLPLRSRSLLLAAIGALAIQAAPASALSITLNVEFDDGTIGPHATVTITESDLGAGSDLHEFYFNLAGDPANIQLTSSQVVNTPFALLSEPSVAGGAGSSFEYGVDFGDGGGPPGNGVLKSASFRVTADQPLTLASLAPLSETSAGIEVHFALHVQGTSAPFSTSETVGGVIPEPGTLLLLGAGLAGLAATGRRSR